MSVTIIGILCIVFGLLGFVSMLVAFAMPHMNPGANPILRELQQDPVYAGWTKISVPMGGLASVVLVVIGIGLLMLRSWARLTLIGYAIYMIVTGVAGGIVTILVYLPKLQGKGSGIEFIGLISGIYGVFVALGYSSLIIIFATRPKIITAFRPPLPAS